MDSELEFGPLSVREDYEGWRFFRHAVASDWKANANDYKARTLLVAFRTTQLAMGSLDNPRKASYPVVVLYRLLSELVLSVELRPRVKVGPGLAIYHGFGLVVNNDAVIGANVCLRHGVTIGHRRAGGESPTLHDNVELGASACVIGPIHIGSGSKIGPNCVVVDDVPAGAVVTLAHEPRITLRREKP